MKNNKLIIIGLIICMLLIILGSYSIVSKISNDNNQNLELVENKEVNIEEIKAQLREEVKEEVKAELYNEVYEKAYQDAYEDINNELESKIAELHAESDRLVQESIEQEEQSENIENNEITKPTNSPTPTQTQIPSTSTTNSSTNTTKNTPYIKVHDVSASASGGTAAIEAALRSAVDGSSGIVMSDASSITGLGTFQINWTSTDGATATSYITITE